MLKPLLTSSLLCCAVVLSVQAEEQDAVAIVNGETVTQYDLEKYQEAVKSRGQQGVALQQQFDLLMEGLIDRELLIQDAKARGIMQMPEFKRELETVKESMLASEALDQYLAENPITEEAIQAKYDELVAETKMPQEYRVSHILFEDEASAQAAITELNEGKDFAELAKAQSTDTASGEQGGELGWVQTTQVVPEFGAAIEAQALGEISTAPIQSQFGWHVVLVHETRKMNPPALENVKSQVESMIRNERMQQYVQALRAEAKIEIMTTEKAEPEEASESEESKD